MSERTHLPASPAPIPAEVWARAHKSGGLSPTTWYAGRVENAASEFAAPFEDEAPPASVHVSVPQLDAVLDENPMPHPVEMRARTTWHAIRRRADRALRRLRIRLGAQRTAA